MTDAGRDDSWAPLTPVEAAELLRDADFRWYVAGGHALELAVGRSWRGHDDLDIGVLRGDLAAVHEHLAGDWQLHVAAAGVLSWWDGRPLAASRAQNNLWVRPAAGGPWLLDLLVGGGDADEWWSRRDATVRVPWPEAVRLFSHGIPHLAPHLQLLMKAKDVRPKDELDAQQVIPALRPAERAWLADHLHADHVWQALLANVDR